MVLKIAEDSKNYACSVIKITNLQPVPGLDNLVKTTVFGNDVLMRKDTDLDQLFLFFPAECRISEAYLSSNNEFRTQTKNADQTQKGYFEDTGRVKAIKFKGVISTGYITPVQTLVGVLSSAEVEWLEEGNEFTDINGVNICKKYKVVHQQSTTSKESRFNKKLKRFDKLVANQFRFHTDTAQLAKNLQHFKPSDIIAITDKWHGTSAVFSNVLINKKLNWLERAAKWLGVDVVDKVYDDLYASRSVIKNQYINSGATAGFYNEDIWKTVHNEVKSKIEQGITLYGEIVGYLQSGKMIQKGYDYGCGQGLRPYPNEEGAIPSSESDYPQHKFVVYRITYTKPNGSVIEFSWQQIKDYCAKFQLETVKELFHGKVGTISPQRLDAYSTDTWLEDLTKLFLEKDCTYCTTKVPAEGVVVRLDGKESYSAYKLKSKRFLERETKQLDEEAKSGEVNIEEQETVSQEL